MASRQHQRQYRILAESTLLLLTNYDFWHTKSWLDDSDTVTSKLMSIDDHIQANFTALETGSQPRDRTDERMLRQAIENTRPIYREVHVIGLLLVLQLVIWICTSSWLALVPISVLISVLVHEIRLRHQQFKRRLKIRCLLSVASVEDEAETAGKVAVAKACLTRHSPQFIPRKFRKVYKRVLADAFKGDSYNNYKDSLERFYEYLY